MASLPLPSSHNTHSNSNSHPDSPSNNNSLPCCCARPDCAVLRQNQSALDKVESDLETAARLGQVCYFFLFFFFFPFFFFFIIITVLYIDSCIPYIYPSFSAFFFFFLFSPPFLHIVPWLPSHTCDCYCFCCVSLSLESCTCLAGHHCRHMFLLYNHEFTGFPIPSSIPSLPCPSWPPPRSLLKMTPSIRPC